MFKADCVAVSAALLGWFNLIPWSNLAACSVFVYTVIRTIFLVVGYFKKRREEETF